MSEEEIRHNKKSRRTLLLVAAVCIAPFIASFTLYYFWQPSGRVNYGELLEAAPMPSPPMKLVDGGAFELSQLKGKWLLLTVDAGACDEYCRKKLWQIRQIRKTQGKYPERIERVWLVSDAIPPAADVIKEYEGMWVVFAGGSKLLDALPHAAAHRDHIYIVDPLGNLVLRYPRDANPSRIKKDLERLLRVSRIG